jgi:hypothetical protein
MHGAKATPTHVLGKGEIMMCIHRRMIALIMASLLVHGVGRAGSSQSPAAASPAKKTCTIAGTLRAGGEPLAEVKVMAKPGEYTALTDSRGRYVIKVPYGWSGRLVFDNDEPDPPSIPYTNVTSDMIDGKPAASLISPPAPSSSAEAEYPRATIPSPAGNALVIPTAEVVPQKFAETAEDMQVMLQVLREKLTEPQMIRGTLIEYGDFFSDLDRTAEVFHLQGHAVVFVIRVDFPLSPPAPAPAAQPDTGKGGGGDPVWQRARQRLNSAGRGGPAGQTSGATFERIKETLLQSLKHAANIRNVGPGELIVLTVISQSEASGAPGPASAGGSYSRNGGGWFEGTANSTASSSFGPGGGSTHADSNVHSRGSMGGRPVPGRTGPGRAPGAAATVLTIQAKKADVDAFAKGELNTEQFQQRARTLTY